VKGRLRERSPGHWAIVIELRDPAIGKRRRKWLSFAGTKRRAQDECARPIAALKGGAYLEPAKITVAEHLERWLKHVRSQVSPKTFERYCGVVRGNILPALGAGLLIKLQPGQISEMYAKALGGGRKDGTGGLSPAAKAGTREKGTKSGRARTVALTAIAIEELRRHQATAPLFDSTGRSGCDNAVSGKPDATRTRSGLPTHQHCVWRRSCGTECRTSPLGSSTIRRQYAFPREPTLHGVVIEKIWRDIPGRENPSEYKSCREEILDNRWPTLVKGSEMPRMVPLVKLDQTGVRLFLTMAAPDVRRASAPYPNAACEPASF